MPSVLARAGGSRHRCARLEVLLRLPAFRHRAVRILLVAHKRLGVCGPRRRPASSVHARVHCAAREAAVRQGEREGLPRVVLRRSPDRGRDGRDDRDAARGAVQVRVSDGPHAAPARRPPARRRRMGRARRHEPRARVRGLGPRRQHGSRGVAQGRELDYAPLLRGRALLPQGAEGDGAREGESVRKGAAIRLRVRAIRGAASRQGRALDRLHRRRAGEYRRGAPRLGLRRGPPRGARRMVLAPLALRRGGLRRAALPLLHGGVPPLRAAARHHGRGRIGTRTARRIRSTRSPSPSASTDSSARSSRSPRSRATCRFGRCADRRRTA